MSARLEKQLKDGPVRYAALSAAAAASAANPAAATAPAARDASPSKGAAVLVAAATVAPASVVPVSVVAAAAPSGGGVAVAAPAATGWRGSVPWVLLGLLLWLNWRALAAGAAREARILDELAVIRQAIAAQTCGARG
jgi:hypothetical protein